MVPFHRQHGQRLVVPVAPMGVEQPGAGCHGYAAGRRAEPLEEEVFTDGHPPFHPGERVGIVSGEPAYLGGQIGRVEHAPGALVGGGGVETLSQFCDNRPRPRVGPADQRGHGAVSLHAHDVVPERGHGHAVDRSMTVPGMTGPGMAARCLSAPGAEVVEHRSHLRHQAVRVDVDTAVRRGIHVVGFLKGGRCDPGRPVEEDRPYGRRADVDGQHAGRLSRVGERLITDAGHGRGLTS